MAEIGPHIVTANRIDRFAYAMMMAFFFLIPGFFIYHWMAILGLIPPALGGYFNESSMLVLVWFALWWGARPVRQRLDVSNIEFQYSMFMLYFVTVVFYHWVQETARDVSLSHVASIIQIAAMFVVFRFTRFDSRFFQRSLTVTVVAISLTVYQAAAAGELGLIMSYTENTKVATYQAFGRMLLLTVMAKAAFTPSPPKRMLHYVNAVILITLIGARSEVAGLIVFAATLEIFFPTLQPIRRKRKSLRVMLVLAALSVLLLIFQESIRDLLPDGRSLLTIEFDSDGSVLAREVQISSAIVTIGDHPILGAYGSYGDTGSYAHNILSAWVDLGVFGFGLLVALLARIAVILATLRRTMPSESFHSRTLYAMSVAILMQTLVFVFTAKAFFDATIPMLVGVTAALLSHLQGLQGGHLPERD